MRNGWIGAHPSKCSVSVLPQAELREGVIPSLRCCVSPYVMHIRFDVLHGVPPESMSRAGERCCSSAPVSCAAPRRLGVPVLLPTLFFTCSGVPKPLDLTDLTSDPRSNIMTPALWAAVV